MSGPSSPPPAPDPVKTAQAQTASNKETAITQTGLNSTNQVTPYGNLTYSQGANWSDGTPHFTATQTLSPEQQKLYDLSTQTQQNVGQIGVDQSSRIGQLLGTPVNLNNDAIESRLFELGRNRLEPQFARDWNDRESVLMNRGIEPGSEGYDREQDAFGRQKNDAYTQLALSGRGQSISEILAARNQPINEITALLSGSQVSQPNFANTPNTSVQPTDVAGITQQAYQNSLLPWQTQNQYNQALMGGLFGLGGAALGGWGRSGGIQKLFG